MSRDRLSLDVVNEQDRLHIALRTYPSESVCAYRTGFEFVDEESDAASALIQENPTRDVTGWKYVPATGIAYTFKVALTKNGPIFFERYQTMALIRQLPSGEFGVPVPIRVDFKNGAGYMSLLADQKESSVYLVTSDPTWNSVEIHEITRDQVDRGGITVAGAKQDFHRRRRWLHYGVIAAWLSHLVLLFAGLDWRRTQERFAGYQFGERHATLASPIRRLIATLIDLVCVCGVIVFAYTRILSLSLPGRSHESVRDYQMLRFEELLLQNNWLEAVRWSPIVGDIVVMFMPGRAEFMYWVALAIACFGLYVVMEWRLGRTPGQQLLGVRAVRTSLRPCELKQFLLRDVFYSIDIPLMLSPLPAVISMILSPHDQRLGDRMADTLVIVDGSIRETSDVDQSMS